MKTSKKIISLGIILLLSTLIISTTTTQAKKPVRTEINFTYHWLHHPDSVAKKEWITDKGILHTLQTPHFGFVDEGGDIAGTLYYCGNLILDLNTYNGKGGGIFEFTGEYHGATAGFRGKLLFNIEFGFITGTLNCPGTGAFAGMLLKGTFSSPLGGTTIVNMVIWNK